MSGDIALGFAVIVIKEVTIQLIAIKINIEVMSNIEILLNALNVENLAILGIFALD